MNERELVIIIDRQYGNGGHAIRKKLSEELGIPLCGQEILEMTPKGNTVGEQFFRPNDEGAGNNLIYQAIRGLKSSPQEPSVEEGITSLESLFRLRAGIIREVVDESSCIIMSYRADYMLDMKAKERLVWLFVYADIPTRIHRVMEVDGVDARKTLKRVNRVSEERRDYYKYYTRKNWENMANYDLLISTTRLELGEAVTLIKGYTKARGCEL